MKATEANSMAWRKPRSNSVNGQTKRARVEDTQWLPRQG